MRKEKNNWPWIVSGAVLLILTLLVMGCQSPCDPCEYARLILASPIVVSQQYGMTMLPLHIENVGTIHALNSRIHLWILHGQTGDILETHDIYLGDVSPQYQFERRVYLESIQLGADIEVREKFYWE